MTMATIAIGMAIIAAIAAAHAAFFALRAIVKLSALERSLSRPHHRRRA